MVSGQLQEESERMLKGRRKAVDEATVKTYPTCLCMDPFLCRTPSMWLTQPATLT